MVSFTDIVISNSAIPTALPPHMVAVFVGATSGIGEVTLKTFARYAQRPRAYFVGRSQDAGDRIVAECKALNPLGEYIFLQADVSLIRVVDEICQEIRSREKCLNVLFLSAGTPDIDRKETREHMHLLAALNFYSRLRFIDNLLSLLRDAPSLSRVVTVAAGGFEGPIDTEDFQALRVPLDTLRGHLATLVTLGLEAVARKAPEVSFIHGYPGPVKTPLSQSILERTGVVPETLEWVPIDECGERHLYLATAAIFPPADGLRAGVMVDNGPNVTLGTSGEIGSGIYSVGWDGQSAATSVLELLTELRQKGMVDQVWEHTQAEFKRITTQ